MAQSLFNNEKIMTSRESGNVLLITLIILVLLTIIGISATRTASIDMQVAGNNMIYKKNLFGAEGAALEAVQTMSNQAELDTVGYTWIRPEDTSEDVIRDKDQFEGISQTSSIDEDAGYSVIRGGLVDTGESLDMTRVKIHEFAVYGRSDQQRGTSIVKLGFRKAY
jgi:hypothetical protein